MNCTRPRPLLLLGAEVDQDPEQGLPLENLDSERDSLQRNAPSREGDPEVHLSKTQRRRRNQLIRLQSRPPTDPSAPSVSGEGFPLAAAAHVTVVPAEEEDLIVDHEEDLVVDHADGEIGGSSGGGDLEVVPTDPLLPMLELDHVTSRKRVREDTESNSPLP